MTIEHFSEERESSEGMEAHSMHIEQGYEAAVPQAFRDDPIGYFEREGINIKPGAIEWKKPGKVKEDPTATKFLPDWTNADGTILRTVGKRVNTAKSQVRDSDDPFYEYTVMQYARSHGLPAAMPIARVEQDGTHLIVMERVPGYGLHDPVIAPLIEKSDLREQAARLIDDLRQRFEHVGIFREKWSPKDMVFDIDLATLQIRSVTPVDWERTKIVPQT